MIVISLLVVITILGILLFKISPAQKQINKTMKNNNETFQLKSTAFRDGEDVPEKYTCDGEDVNPLLEIKNPPAGTKSFTLIVDDPDATGGNVWDHWLIWNISPKTQYISEDSAPSDTTQGKNSFGKQKYGGPCPPFGHNAHHYRFAVYALDTILDIPQESGSVELKSAIKGHIIEEVTLIGLYKRKM